MTFCLASFVFYVESDPLRTFFLKTKEEGILHANGVSFKGDKFEAQHGRYTISTLSAFHTSFVLDRLPHLCHVKVLGIVAKRLQQHEFTFNDDVLVLVAVVVAKAP